MEHDDQSPTPGLRPPLIGEHEGVFTVELRSGGSFKAGLQDLAFPIVVRTHHHFEWIGTGFFLGYQGLFATARHVFMDMGEGMAAHGLFLRPDGKMTTLAILPPIHHAVADVAYSCAIDTSLPLAEQPIHPVLQITTHIAQPGTKLATLGYPRSQTQNFEDGSAGASFMPSAFRGEVLEFCPNGTTLNRGPCYVTSIPLHGQNSGGPVFEEATGYLVGIASSGVKPTDAHCSYSIVAAVESLLEMPFAYVVDDRPENGMQLRQYINQIGMLRDPNEPRNATRPFTLEGRPRQFT